MKNNSIKNFKILIILLVMITGFSFSENVNAVSGACSSHDGVNCSAGRQLNGKVYCNDGWSESIADYDFVLMCKNYKYNCNIEEWNNLSQKYNLEDKFFELQNIIDNNLDYFFQTQYNTVKNQYDLALSLTERECEALGSDRASQQNYERIKSDFYDTQIKKEEDKIAQIEREKQKLTEDYLKVLEDLNTPQYTCPINSTKTGNSCICNSGYVISGNQCISNTEDCQNIYGNNVIGVSGNSNNSSCSCVSGYEWNTPLTTCVQTKIKTITSLSAPKPIIQEDSFSEEVKAEKDMPTKKTTVKTEDIEKEPETILESEEVKPLKEQVRAKLFTRIFDSIKSFFWNIFN